MKNSIFFLFLFLLGTACRKEEPVLSVEPLMFDQGQGVFVVHEGNFQAGNASIGFVDTRSNKYLSDIYADINQLPLGDVLQSMQVIGDKGYLIVNGSDKIEVVDIHTFQILHTITSVPSPRYLLPAGGNKAYVSSLFGNHITVIDLEKNQVTGSIPLSGWTEQMAIVNGKVWVTNWSKSYLYQLDPALDQVVDSIAVGPTGTALQVDHQNRLWLLCSGNAFENVPAALYQLDVDAGKQVKKLSFPAEDNVTGRMAINPGKDTLFYVREEKIYFQPVADTQTQDRPYLADSKAGAIYGLATDPRTGEIWLSDAKGFTQAGEVHRFSRSGLFIKSYTVDLIPSDFFFY